MKFCKLLRFWLYSYFWVRFSHERKSNRMEKIWVPESWKNTKFEPTNDNFSQKVIFLFWNYDFQVSWTSEFNLLSNSVFPPVDLYMILHVSDNVIYPCPLNKTTTKHSVKWVEKVLPTQFPFFFPTANIELENVGEKLVRLFF